MLCSPDYNRTEIEELGEEVRATRGWNITVVTYDSAIPQIKDITDIWRLSQNNRIVFVIPAGEELLMPNILVSPDLETILPVANRTNIVHETMMADFLNVDYCSAVKAGLQALLEDKVLMSALTFEESYAIKNATEPEWQRTNGNEFHEFSSSPVCYKRNDMMQLLPTFTYVGQAPSGAIKIKAIVNGQEYITNGETADGNIIQPTNNEAISVPSTNTVDYWPDFEISWSLSLDGGASWKDMGKTKNTVYFTWGEPSGEVWDSNLQELVFGVHEEFLYYGCKLAKGVESENIQDVIDELWQPFKDRNIKIGHFKPKKGPIPLTYYKTPEPTHVSINIIAFNPQDDYDGECGAFESTFSVALKSQGISNDRKTLRPKNTEEGVLIKGWDFVKETYPDTDYPYENKYVKDNQIAPRIAGQKYLWRVPPDVVDLEGVSGQGKKDSPNPYADFYLHYVTAVNGRIYDPSYGEWYTNVKDWEDAAVVGFFVFKRETGDHGTNALYKIRKNTEEDEITTN